MNDGQYTNIRNYLEETNGLLRQVLAALQGSNALPASVAAPKVPAEAVGTATVETVETVDTGKTDTPPQGPVEMAVQSPLGYGGRKQPGIPLGKDAAPWLTYDTDADDAIIARLRNMQPGERNKALAYERKNKNRVNITKVNWNS